MKKLLTLSLLAASAFAMSAETLWTGSCSFTNWSPIEGDERPVLTTSDFANVQVGDKLVLTISIYGEDSWREAQIYTWNGSGTGSLVVGSGAITEGMTAVEFTFDDSLIAAVKESDICVIGTGYTVTRIDLNQYDGTIWEGECLCPDWNADPAVNLPGSNFSMAKEGDQLIFYVEVLNPGDWAAIQIDTANWAAGPFGQNVLSDDTTEISFILDADLLESLTTDGINITGANFKLTKIQLVNADEVTPPAEDGDEAIWSGSVTPSWDSPLYIDKGQFTEVVAGNVLIFSYENASGEPQLVVDYDGSEGWTAMPYDGEEEYGNYLHLNEENGEVTFTINAAAAEILKTYGLMLAGEGTFTLTKVELETKGSTGISKVNEILNVNAPVYNLQGVKVADSVNNVTKPGIYVTGGKKIIVK